MNNLIVLLNKKGGSGSGDFGHTGRAGKHGGSRIMSEYAEAVSAEFGASLSSYEKDLIKNQEGINRRKREKLIDFLGPEDAARTLDSLKTLPLKDRKNILGEMYENTQKYFRDNDITEVLVYRGYAASNDDQIAINTKQGDIVGYDTNSIESWSLSQKVAISFANVPSSNRTKLVFAAKIPVERILSMPETGAGVAKEQEFLVIGNGVNDVSIHSKSVDIN